MSEFKKDQAQIVLMIMGSWLFLAVLLAVIIYLA